VKHSKSPLLPLIYAPVMMGKKRGCLKLMKDDNPEMLPVICVIHREN
jgi:hypothetical protein